MRKLLFLFAVLAGAGIGSLTATSEAQAQCTHLGSSGACPVGIPDGSTSAVVNADGTIRWNNGGISGPCCAAPAGTESGGGLLNLNNQLGNPGAGNNPSGTTDTGGSAPPQGGTGDFVDAEGRIILSDATWEDGQCSGYQCQNGPGATLFGSGPNSGYQCDSGGPGCGNDLWNGLPQSGFGECGPGGCGGAPTLTQLNPGFAPIGPYAQNTTLGQVDPFGGGLNLFLDPATGQTVELDEDRTKWPEHVQHADELNNAFINGQIPFYPFDDPDWENKSIDDFRNSSPPPPNTQAGLRFDAPVVFAPDGGAAPANAFPSVNIGPYSQNRTVGDNIDPFGGVGSFTDPRTGESVSLPDNEAEWPDKYKKAAELNSAYVNGEIAYPFNDPDWENKSADDFKTPAANTSEQAMIRDFFSYDATFNRKDGDTGLTDYVSYVLITIPKSGSGAAPPKPDGAQTFTGAFGDTPVRLSKDDNGTYEIFVPGTGEKVTTTNPALAEQMATAVRNGKPLNEVIVEVYGPNSDPATRDETTTANSPDIGDSLLENVPMELRAPFVGERTRDDGSNAIFVKLPGVGPGTGTELGFAYREGADAMVEALRDGKTVKEAYDAGRRADSRIARAERERRELAEDTGITTTADGLASASVPGARSRQTGRRPARPAGDSAGFMEEALFQGSVYRIEIIRTPDGRTLAVGTGEHADHVFGETKEGSFGWRREGPWTPPPVTVPFAGDQRPAIIVKPSDNGGVVDSTLPGTIEPDDKVSVSEIGRAPGPGGNEPFAVNIAVGIANSDRDHMIQNTFQDDFESGNTSPWTSTER